MNENHTQYHANAIEKYWQNVWEKKNSFQTKKDTEKEKLNHSVKIMTAAAPPPPPKPPNPTKLLPPNISPN